MRILSFFVFCSTALSALDYEPWFSPLWEIETDVVYFFSHGQKVQSPKGDFSHLFNNHEFFSSLGTTITPSWNVAAEIGFVKIMDEKFLFEFIDLRARKLWLDDIDGDFITLTTNLSLLFTQKNILEQYEFPFHGYANAELQLGIGKEFLFTHSLCWNWRLHSLLGIGIAERGCPWFHGVLGLDKTLSSQTTMRLIGEYLQGFGNNDLIPYEPFPGYGLIAHRSLSITAIYSYELGVFGNLNFIGFLTLYSKNFPIHILGAGLCLEIPFGF